MYRVELTIDVEASNPDAAVCAAIHRLRKVNPHATFIGDYPDIGRAVEKINLIAPSIDLPEPSTQCSVIV